MSRILAELLGVNSLGFRLNVEQLERASGDPAVDIRLTSEITQATLQKIKQLGLDYLDTTPEELDQALRQRLSSDDLVLSTAIGINRTESGQTAGSVVRLINSISMPRKCFALKHSVAKRILKKNIPKVTLRRLGYRSLDSLLKREPTAMIFVVATRVENSTWKRNLYEEFKSLSPSDFEVRDVEVHYFSKQNSQRILTSQLIAQEKTTVLVAKELGGVIILSPPEDVPASTTATLVFALQAINDIRIHSAFCKLQQVKPDFGLIMAESIKGDVKSLAIMAGQPVPWHVLQTYFSQATNDYPIELFEPHVQKEDLTTLDIESSLASLIPSFRFWTDTRYLAYNDSKQIVSLNIKDVAANLANNLAYENRVKSNFREEAWTQLMIRYLNQEQLQKNVLQQLDAQLVDQQVENGFGMTFAEAA